MKTPQQKADDVEADARALVEAMYEDDFEGFALALHGMTNAEKDNALSWMAGYIVHLETPSFDA